MQLVAFFLGLAVQAVITFSAPVQKGQVDYYDPAALGGSMLNKATATLGEPLNVSLFS
jgi:hypothetical protein